MKGENSLTNKENKEVFKNKDTTKQKQLNQKQQIFARMIKKTYHS